MATLQYTLPDVLVRWPYSRLLSPHYETVGLESTRWLESYNIFPKKTQIAFNRCDFARLALMGWPEFDQARSRVCCDLMNLFFMIDEQTDGLDADTVKQMLDIVRDALRNPHQPRPSDEWIGGEVARDFWARAMPLATPISQKRFVAAFFECLDGLAQEAVDRKDHHVRNFDSYLDIRRETIGCKPVFAFIELELEIPNDVFNHPSLTHLRLWANEMICIANDIYSYNVEQSRGDDLHNMVTIIMHQYNLDVRDAMAWIGEYNDHIASSFIASMKQIPSWGAEIDAQVAHYVRGLGMCVKGNDQWHWESHRYFGTKGAEIMKHRVVDLLPQVDLGLGTVINIPSDHYAPPATATLTKCQ